MKSRMSRFYVTTPIYYVNDVPHIGHAYTTVAGDVLTRWRRLCGDEVFYLTGTDEHGLKVQRAAEAHGVTPKELVDETAGALPRRRGTASTSPTTTSSARPSRGTTRRCSSSCRRSTTTATSSSAPTKASTASRARRTTPRTSWSTATARSTARPVELVVEQNYFFKLSRYTDRLLAYYAAHPEAVQPESRMNEVLGFIRGGLQDFSMSRTSIDWGVPLPWDPAHVAYVWADALFNYCTAVGYATDDGAVREVVARRLPPRRQGHPPLPRGVLARDADGGRARAAPLRVRARLAARRRREDEQDAAQPDRARRSRRRLRRRRLPLSLHGRPTLRPRRRLLVRGDGAAVQRRSRQQLRQPREPRAQHGDELLRRRRARRARRRSAAGDGGDHVRGDVRRADAARLRERVRRGLGSDPRDERLHRGLQAVGAQQAGRHRPRSRRCSATASSRCGSSRCSRRR